MRLKLKWPTGINIYCGDYRKVLRDVQAQLIFTSPPYNIGSKSERKDGQRCKGKYDAKSFGGIRDYADSLPEDEYQKQQATFLKWAASHLNPNGVLVYNHKPRRNGHMIHPMEWFLQAPELRLMEEVIWDRGSTHNHSNRMLWPQTERLYVFLKKGEKYPFINNQRLAHRSDVWRIPRARSNSHNAPFPLELAIQVIEAWSNPGDLVCDPYTGSGTVAMACKQLGRRFEGAEILPKYFDLARRRVA